ncbi:hypothetical protein [Streptosporangium saharense]|uniref:hypothetical protein n=1 Tax=Streptosporangium saharense TaxID=1706840 RepID=UPI0036BC5098
MGSLKVDQFRDSWIASGIPTYEIDRVADYAARWGGLVLPPAPYYDGGPRVLSPDIPEGSPAEGWSFEAGPQRTALPYSFMIGPGGEFGIHGDRWVPLHATVEGWVESVALAYHASMWAKEIIRVTADEVEAIPFKDYEPIQEVAGITDTWWRGADSLVVVYRGEAEHFAAPGYRTALVYTGLDRWGLHGG